MAEVQEMRGEKIYECDFNITGVTDYGVPLRKTRGTYPGKMTCEPVPPGTISCSNHPTITG
jgi:hypothetical protein